MHRIVLRGSHPNAYIHELREGKRFGRSEEASPMIRGGLEGKERRNIPLVHSRVEILSKVLPPAALGDL